MDLHIRHYYSVTALFDVHHITCEINFLIHSVNLILFTLLLVHLILHVSPHHSPHLCSHHLSLPRPFTAELKLVCFTNPLLHSLPWLLRPLNKGRGHSFWYQSISHIYDFLYAVNNNFCSRTHRLATIHSVQTDDRQTQHCSISATG